MAHTNLSTDNGIETPKEDTFECPQGEHDLEAQNRYTLIEARGAYASLLECQHEDCGLRKLDVDVEDVPADDNDLMRMLYQLYESFYENPRSVPRAALSALPTGEPFEAEFGLEVMMDDIVDLACWHAENGCDPFDPDELFDELKARADGIE